MKRTYYVLTNKVMFLLYLGLGIMCLTAIGYFITIGINIHSIQSGHGELFDSSIALNIALAALAISAVIYASAFWIMPKEEIEANDQTQDIAGDDVSATTTQLLSAASVVNSSASISFF